MSCEGACSISLWMVLLQDVLTRNSIDLADLQNGINHMWMIAERNCSRKYREIFTLLQRTKISQPFCVFFF